MGRVYDVPWTIQETRERVLVTLDEEGYSTFVALRDATFRDGAFIVHGEEREMAVREIDTLMCLYVYAGARMSEEQMRVVDEPSEPELDALTIFDAAAAQNPLLAVPESVRAQFAHGPSPRPPERPASLPYRDSEDERDPEPPAWSTTATLPDPSGPRIGRFSNPDTSGAPDSQRLGAIAVYPRSGTQRRKILDILAAAPSGLTDEEIEQALGLGQRQVSTRRHELGSDGWVQDSGRRKLSSAKVEVVIWELTDAGRVGYAKLPEAVVS